jgi:hypothetical protein
MSLKIILDLGSVVWKVMENNQPVAELYFSYQNEINEVLLDPDSPEEVQLSVLRFALSFQQELAKVRKTNNFTLDAQPLLNFGIISEEAAGLDREAVMKELRHSRVSVVLAIHQTADEAIKAAIAEAGVESLRYSVIPVRMTLGNEIHLRFTVAKPDRFTFWKCELKPSDYDGLHIIPAYHPSMTGRKSAGMVNGATDAYIGGKVIRSVYCPRAAQSDRHGRNFGTTWDHLKHPFYATGRSMGVQLITTAVRSAEGVKQLAEFLQASLSHNEQYVEISGGFRAPLKCPHNRLLELKRRSPWQQADYRSTGNVARGSEDHCVWAYRTLQEEGALEEAYVPAWFHNEDWVGIYEGAAVGPNLY